MVAATVRQSALCRESSRIRAVPISWSRNRSRNDASRNGSSRRSSGSSSLKPPPAASQWSSRSQAPWSTTRAMGTGISMSSVRFRCTSQHCRSPELDDAGILDSSSINASTGELNGGMDLDAGADSSDGGSGLGPSDEQVRASMIHLLNPVLGSAFGVSSTFHRVFYAPLCTS
ncbi:hypothetical protein ANCDUO_04144 [Ancylostoma duodenale]|uniref:Uncharacterized protein n=1 Tax=Ancylostoma duodenale TaxID=51022 RepID=A0A0C2H1S7_9BILA|nr:hypothetical protein ANCDUO_04144 [Ancylostoma duodenale]